MRIRTFAVLSCAFAAMLSTTARAQGLRSDGPFAFRATAGEVSAQGADEATGGRVAMEMLAGGLGSVGGGFAGLLIGAGSGDLATAGFGLIGGAALGSWLGVSVGGHAMGGRGDWGGAFLGTLAGSVTSLVLAVAMGPDSGNFALAMVFALPVSGGAIGYEISHAMNLAAPSGPLQSLHPSLSLSRDGKTALTGVAGTF